MEQFRHPAAFRVRRTPGLGISNQLQRFRGVTVAECADRACVSIVTAPPPAAAGTESDAGGLQARSELVEELSLGREFAIEFIHRAAGEQRMPELQFKRHRFWRSLHGCDSERKAFGNWRAQQEKGRLPVDRMQ